MAVVKDQLGQAFADRLVAGFGGRRIYIPKRVPARGRLTDVFDPSELARLIDVIGGDHVDVPVGRGNAAGRARRVAKSMLMDKVPAHEVANRVGLSRRSIYYLKDEMRQAGELPPRGRGRL